MYKKILVPLDGSLASESALETAMQVGQAFHAEVLLLRSIQLVYSSMPIVPGEYGWQWPEYAREDTHREILDYLDKIRRLYDCPDCHVRSTALEGDPASCIVDTAEEGIDLIVMSTHGQTGMRRAIFGSVTERVLHSVKCPVLVTRSKEPIRRILITLDGSPLAEKALLPALEISRAIGARIILLRVNEAISVNPLEVAVSWDWDIPESEQKRMSERRRTAESYLKDVALRFNLSLDEVETFVLDGSPVDRIQEFARLYGIDLIAMSTHGHGGLRRWLYGSVAAKVMRGSHCSMLIIRPPAAELIE
jgi:nucleotide-binding universal stress UspA family protein